MDPRQVPRLHGAARRPHRQGQALVLRAPISTSATPRPTWASTLDDPLSFKRYYDDRYLFKLNWQVSPSHKVVGTFHLDKKSTDNGVDVGEAPSTAWTRRSKTPTPGLAYTGVLSDKTVVEVRYSGFYGDVTGFPTDPDQPRDLPRFYDLDTGIDQRRALLLVRGRAPADHGHGQGLAPGRRLPGRQPRLPLRRAVQRRRGPRHLRLQRLRLHLLLDGYPDYGFGYERQPFSYSGNSRNLGVFFDDTVRVNDRLSFNVGLRYDHNKAFCRRAGRAGRVRRAHGHQLPAHRPLHLEELLAAAGLQPEADRGRQDRAQGPLGPVPPLHRHRRVRQRHRAQRQAHLLGRLRLRPSTASTPRASCSSRATATWAWTRTTRARAPTSTS